MYFWALKPLLNRNLRRKTAVGQIIIILQIDISVQGADIIRPRFMRQFVAVHSVGVGDSTTL